MLPIDLSILGQLLLQFLMQPDYFELFVSREASFRYTWFNQLVMKICEILDIVFIELLLMGRFVFASFLDILKLQRVAKLLTEFIGLVDFADA